MSDDIGMRTNTTKHRGEDIAYRQGVIDGKTEGYDVGYRQGYDHGYQQGDTDNAVVYSNLTVEWCDVHRVAYDPPNPNPAATKGICLVESEFGSDDPASCRMVKAVLHREDTSG